MSTDEPRRPALPLDRLAGLEARRPARARAARVRDAARGGLRAGQAPRDGLRDDHRSRHDRRRARDRRPPRRVRLRGADRPLPRRAAGGARPLLRDHARRPRVAAGARRRRRGRRRRTCTSSEIACALAHPFYAVEAPLTAAPPPPAGELFPIWEVRNGSRAPRAQPPGRDLHRDARRHRHRRLRRPRRRRHRPHLHRDARRARRRDEFLAPHPRRRASSARGEQGSAAKWAHAAMALAIRALGRGDGDARARPARGAADGRARDARGRRARAARSAPTSAPTTPARCCAPGSTRSTSDLRRARAARAPAGRRLLATPTSTAARAARHERKLRARGRARRRARRGGGGDLGAAPRAASSTPASPAIPYAPATAFLGAREGASSPRREGEPPRVALVADGDRRRCTASRTRSSEIRERGVPGFEVEVIGTDPNVDRRLSAVAEVDMPVLRRAARSACPACRRSSRRSPRAATTSSTSARPGPAGRRRGADRAASSELPLVGSYHTELAAYAGAALAATRGSRRGVRRRARRLLRRAATWCSRRARPSDARARASSASTPARIGRWDRGVDLERFSTRRCATRRCCPATINVLYAGRLTHEKGVDLLADAFLAARARDPRLHLVLAGGGPEEERAARAPRRRTRRSSAGSRATTLARAYASADLFLFCSQHRHVRPGAARGAGQRACRSSRSPRAARPS